MGNVGKPDKRPKYSAAPEDIPVAMRDHLGSRPTPSFKKALVLGSGAAAIALVLGVVVAYQFKQPTQVGANTAPAGTSPTNTPSSPDGKPAADGTLLNHFPYNEAPSAELQAISPDGGIRLRKAAAKAFKEMVAAAQADGVSLFPISGFRSVEDQNHLFFDVKAERGQGATKRAEVSAPPGYSEHHTGYAVDLGDSSTPATNLSQTFEQTAAFKWLEANAARYSFELSFPKGNTQGVSYEPWHWRFVGDRDSLETFYKARSRK